MQIINCAGYRYVDFSASTWRLPLQYEALYEFTIEVGELGQQLTHGEPRSQALVRLQFFRSTIFRISGLNNGPNDIWAFEIASHLEHKRVASLLLTNFTEF